MWVLEAAVLRLVKLGAAMWQAVADSGPGPGQVMNEAEAELVKARAGPGKVLTVLERGLE